jgi:hypothetical protein
VIISGRLPNVQGCWQMTGVRRIDVRLSDMERPQVSKVVRLPRGEWIARARYRALRDLGLNHGAHRGWRRDDRSQFLSRSADPAAYGAHSPTDRSAGATTRPVAALAQARHLLTSSYALGSNVVFDCVRRALPVSCSFHPRPFSTSVLAWWDREGLEDGQDGQAGRRAFAGL